MRNKKMIFIVMLLLGAFFTSGCGGSDQSVILTDTKKAGIDARFTLLKSVEDKDPFTRSMAVEALSKTMGAKGCNIYIQTLNDPEPVVRFAAAMAIGDNKCMEAKPQLEQMAKFKVGERDKRVYIAVIYALAELDQPKYLGDLSKLLFDEEKEIRANAAMVLGKLGDPAAIKPLKTLLAEEQDAMVQLQVVESLARLGDARSIIVLEAYTKTTFLDERLVAIPAMAKLGNRRAAVVLEGLLDKSQPPRVRLAAAGALAQLGKVRSDLFFLCAEAAENPNKFLTKAYGSADRINPDEVVSTQTLAIISLGEMKAVGAVDVLQPLLNSNEGQVRVSAAMSILKLLPKYQNLDQPKAQSQPAEKADKEQPAAASRPKLISAGAKD